MSELKALSSANCEFRSHPWAKSSPAYGPSLPRLAPRLHISGLESPPIREDAMRKTICTTGKLLLFAFALVAPVVAQNALQAEPIPAGSGPRINLGAGYSSVVMSIPGARHVNLNGFGVNASADLRPAWGVTVDGSYARASNFLGTARGGYLATLYTGPVFYPFERGNTRVFLHALGGVSVVDGAEPASSTQFRHGWFRRPSYAVGGGVEHALEGPFSVRVSGDYLRTSFFNAAGAAQPQSDLRFTVGLVFGFRRWGSF